MGGGGGANILIVRVLDSTRYTTNTFFRINSIFWHETHSHPNIFTSISSYMIIVVVIVIAVIVVIIII